MRILIAGYGYVGEALGRILADRGDEVIALRRSAAPVPAGVRLVRGDLTDPATLTDLPGKIDAVAYTASPDTREDEAYRRSYVEGPVRLLEALEEKAGPPDRFVLVTSTAVHGGVSDGSEVTEDTPPQPADFRGERLLEGEEAVAARIPGAVALRLGGIYGPGRTRLVERVEEGEARCPGHPLYTNRIHRDDAAGALAHLLRLDDPDPVYLGVDREPADLCDVLRWLARRVGAPEPEVAEDRGDGEDGEDGDVERGPPRGRRGRGKRCRSDRLEASGYGFLFPTFRDGYEAVLTGTP